VFFLTLLLALFLRQPIHRGVYQDVEAPVSGRRERKRKETRREEEKKERDENSLFSPTLSLSLF